MSDFIDFKKDGVWEHFLREKGGNSAKCKLCSTILKATGGSTKGLHEHLKRIHSVSVLKRQSADDDTGPSTSSAPTHRPGPMKKYLIDNLEENSLAATLSRLTACDGLSFNVIATSMDLRRGLVAMGFSQVPSAVATIKQHVMAYGQRVRSFVMTDLEKKKAEGQRFSLTFDEWTSKRNRRYMNINVHARDGEYWSLGLLRVHGSMPADKCVALVEQKLGEFGLNLSTDIVCICTDGASVMKKVGKLMAVEQQLCYAHGVQLAVLDVLYGRRTSTAAVAEVEPETESTTPKDDDDDAMAAEHGEGLEIVQDTNDSDVIAELSGEYKEVVDKVRAVVRIFRRSPTKNDAVLQVYVKREFGKELSLSLDCRTRWNSLFDMLSRYLHLRTAVQKAMIDLKQPVHLTDADFAVVQDIVSTLEPVKLAVTALCRRAMTLVTAETALNFCLVQLRKQSSELAKTLAIAIEERLNERRAVHAGVLAYLHSTSARSTATELFSVPSNATIKKFVHQLYTRLNTVNSAEESPVAVSGADDAAHGTDADTTSTLTLEQQLEIAITESSSSTTPSTPSTSHAADKLLSAVKAEMSVYEASGTRGRCLDAVYKYLLTVPPTSVEAERAFSAAGVLCAKLRSRLDDFTVDTLCFLRAYYKSRK